MSKRNTKSSVTTVKADGVESVKELKISQPPLANQIIKIKPEVQKFISGKGIPEYVRQAELYISRINPNGTIVIAYSSSMTEIDALFAHDVEPLNTFRTSHDSITECPKVSIRIFGVPERMECIRENQKRLGIPDELIFIDENHEGCVPTAKRAWTYPTDKEFVLVLQDDIELCDNFMQYVNVIVDTHPDAIISLFSLQLTRRLAVNRIPSVSPYIASNQASGQGIIMKTEYVQSCIDAWKEEIKGDDTNIAAWANENGITILTTIPTTIQHLGEKSYFAPSRSLGKSEFYDKNPDYAAWGNSYVTNVENILRG